MLAAATRLWELNWKALAAAFALTGVPARFQPVDRLVSRGFCELLEPAR